MADPFAPLHGRSFVPFAREAAGSFRWDRIDVAPGGSFTLESAVEGMMSGAPHVPPELRSPPALTPVFAALSDGGLGLVATGDHSLNFTEGLVVPPGLLEGWFRVYNAEEFLVALDAEGREVGPRYYRPRFAPARGGQRAPSPVVNENERPAYGTASQAVRAAIVEHPKELTTIKTRKDRAIFLAGKVGCSRSTAEKVLREDGK